MHNPARGLIAENYVDCDPGSANSPALTAQGGFPPTVPVTNTTEPVSLLDLFNIFNLPTRQRFMVIVDELGIGTAARGQDFNDILRRAKPALKEVDTVAVDGTPLLQQIHTAVPSLNAVASNVGPFVAAAKPALAKLGAAVDTAIPAIRDLTPVVATLGSYLTQSLPSTIVAARLFSNVQKSGFVENLLNAFYYIGVAAARYDSVSHMVPSYLINVNNGACSLYATTPVAGCSAHYGASPAYPTPKVADRRSARKAASSAGTTTATQPASTTTASAAPSSAPGAPAAPSGPSGLVPGAITQERQLAKQLIAKILHGAGPVTGSALSQLQSALQGSGSHSDQSLQKPQSYLLR